VRAAHALKPEGDAAAVGFTFPELGSRGAL